MKHGKPCPKCGSHNRLEQLQKSGITEKESIFADIPFTRSVCVDCGYFEDWYLPERIAVIKERLERSHGDNRW